MQALHLYKEIKMETVIHPWKPIIDDKSKVLILGSIPSPKSRENGFYYGHPQNIFWSTIEQVVGDNIPENNPKAKTEFLLKNHIAIWDVLYSCEISGASDQSIINPVPNKFKPLLEKSNITAIFTTGKKATELFNKLCSFEAGMQAIYLPSTSPANRGLQGKVEFWNLWNKVRDVLKGTE